MTTLSQFVGGNNPPTTVSSGAATGANLNSFPGVAVNSGALTANTYPTTAQVSITGQGVVGLVSAYNLDATSRTITVKVEIDGVTVTEGAIVGVSTTNTGVFVIGCGSTGTTTSYFALDQIPFNKSLKIFLKTSDTQTDLAAIKYVARYR